MIVNGLGSASCGEHAPDQPAGEGMTLPADRNEKSFERLKFLCLAELAPQFMLWVTERYPILVF